MDIKVNSFQNSFLSKQLSEQSIRLQMQTLPIALVLLAVISRLIPHWPNFTAVGAMAFFAGSTMGFRYRSILVPLSAMLLTDVILGFHSTMFVVYGAIVLNVLIGAKFLADRSTAKIIGVSLLASLQFFVFTNFAVWALGGMYVQNLHGLVQSFVMALPFLPNQIFADLTYGLILFATYAFAQNKLRPAKV